MTTRRSGSLTGSDPDGSPGPAGVARGQPVMFPNVTVSFAVLAVLLVGDGTNSIVPVPEHGTVMLVGMSFFT
jgi:hypothetical protein